MILCAIATAGELGTAIEMESSHTVGSFKDAIRAKQSPSLDHSPASTLTLVLIFKDDVGGIPVSDLRQRSVVLDLETYGEWPEEGVDLVSKFSKGDAEGSCFRSEDGYFFKVLKTGMKLSHYTDSLTLKEGLCHILVLTQYIHDGFKFNPENPTENTHYKAYRSRGQTLARHETVTGLVDKINEMYSQYDSGGTIPFVVLEGSSGVGKTQTAFTLMEHFTVGYVPCMYADNDSLQPIYAAFQDRIMLFRNCIREDLANYSAANENNISIAHLSNSSDVKLFSYAFITSLLTGRRKKLKPITRSKAIGRLSRLSKLSDPKRCVFFMDEFPVHNNRSNDSNEVKNRLRFMRNVVGALGIVGIISSTHSSAMNMRMHGNEASRGDDDPKLWCYVVPRFPPFIIPSDANIPSWLGYILIRSRPWFAHIALQHYQNFGVISSVRKYLDQMFRAVWSSAERGKAFESHGFLHGQVCLLLSVNHFESRSDNSKYNVIEKHFAQLDRDGLFPLYLSNKGLHNKDLTEWIHRVVYPTAEEDFLLHLVFLGGKEFRAFCDTYSRAVQTTKSHQLFNLSFENSNVKSCDGLEAEAIRFGAAVLASRVNGMRGMSSKQWIVSFMKKLGIVSIDIKTPFKSPAAISSYLKHIKIPYLGAPNVDWPEVLPEEFGEYLGKFSRTLNNDRIDGRVGSEVTFEVKDWTSSFGTPDMESALLRMPSDTKLHIILVNSNVKIFYNRKRKANKESQTYSEFVQRNQNLLAKTRVYKLSGNGYEEFGGITNECHCPRIDHQNCLISSVVLVLQTA